MVGRRDLAFWETLFSGAFAVSPEVQQAKLQKFVENEISMSFFRPNFRPLLLWIFWGFCKVYTPPGSLTASKSPWKVIFNTRKGSSSNHHFSAAFAVKLREGVLFCSESFGFLALNNLKQRLVLELLGEIAIEITTSKLTRVNSGFFRSSCDVRSFPTNKKTFLRFVCDDYSLLCCLWLEMGTVFLSTLPDVRTYSWWKKFQQPHWDV